MFDLVFSFKGLPFTGRLQVKAGDTFGLAVVGDEGARVSIKCFVNYPPPPQYKECEDCGDFEIGAGFPLVVTASTSAFQDSGGQLKIHATGATSGQVVERAVDVIGG